MKRARLAGAVGISILLAACVPEAKPDPNAAVIGPHQLTPQESEAVMNGVRSVLKDPYSAMFGNAGATKRADGLVTVCGMVNAKNSFGGYTGAKPFIGLLMVRPVPHFSVASMGSDSIATDVTLQLCRNAGINIY